MRAVVAQRSIKEECEIDEIEDALAVTAGMYRATMRAAAAGRSEAELAAIHMAEAISAGCGQAFSPIVTVHGEVLHNVTYENTLVDGDLLLVDSGAEAPSGYASDITRTMPVSGRLQQPTTRYLRGGPGRQSGRDRGRGAGVTNRELHLLAARTVASGLKDLGLMQGDVDAAVEAGAHAMFFVHGLGHMMGLDVHDMEDLGDVVGYERGEERSTPVRSRLPSARETARERIRDHHRTRDLLHPCPDRPLAGGRSALAISSATTGSRNTGRSVGSASRTMC